MEGHITFMKTLDVDFSDSGPCHGCNNRCELPVRGRCKVLSSFPNRNRLKGYANFLNQTEVLGAKLRYVCSALWRLAQKALMLEFMQRLAQSWLSNAEPHRPFLFDYSIAA